MTAEGLLLLGSRDVAALLEGEEQALIDVVHSVYEAHGRGRSVLPNSCFLPLPGPAGNRMIALPAYLAEPNPVIGVKWIASFPENRHRGFDRASAVIVLNSPETGRPTAVLEGAQISAARTAASAALAALTLSPRAVVGGLGLIGCGLINRTVARFVRATTPGLRRMVLYDSDPIQAEQLRGELTELDVTLAADATAVLAETPLVSLATTALTPHIHDLPDRTPEGLILHLSLRDLSPELIVACDNVVDDVDHVCRAQTSLHLAEQARGDRKFIRGTLSDVLLGHMPARSEAQGPAVFSPFGLGVLDVAVAEWVRSRAGPAGLGLRVHDFHPKAAWS